MQYSYAAIEGLLADAPREGLTDATLVELLQVQMRLSNATMTCCGITCGAVVYIHNVVNVLTHSHICQHCERHEVIAPDRPVQSPLAHASRAAASAMCEIRDSMT